MPTEVSAPVKDSPASTWFRRISQTRPKYLLFALIGVMYAYVLWNNESFLINSKDPEWTHIQSFRWWLLPHGLTAACALFLGPLQFSDRLRRRFAKAHRVMGRFYVAGVLLGAPLGIYIQYLHERIGGQRSFTIATVADAGLWIFATLVALAFILQGKVQQHRQWMTRSFACAIIFLEVRAIGGIFNVPLKFTEVIVWCCVAAAYPLADFVLQWPDLFRPHAKTARVARPAAQAV
jgi:uncharacterized membrane protein